MRILEKRRIIATPAAWRHIAACAALATLFMLSGVAARASEIGADVANAVKLRVTAGAVPPGGILPVHVEVEGDGFIPDTLVLKLTFDTERLQVLDVAAVHSGDKLTAHNPTESGLALVVFGGTSPVPSGRLVTVYLEAEASAPLGATLPLQDAGSSAAGADANALPVTLTAEAAQIEPMANPHKSDRNGNGRVELGELLRVIQLYNAGQIYCDAGTEDGYSSAEADRSCTPHSLDYAPQDWRISLSELLRCIQFYNAFANAYHEDNGGEDGFGPGPRD